MLVSFPGESTPLLTENEVSSSLTPAANCRGVPNRGNRSGFEPGKIGSTPIALASIADGSIWEWRRVVCASVAVSNTVISATTKKHSWFCVDVLLQHGE